MKEQWEIMLQVIDELIKEGKEEQVNEIIQEGRFLDACNMLD